MDKGSVNVRFESISAGFPNNSLLNISTGIVDIENDKIQLLRIESKSAYQLIQPMRKTTKLDQKQPITRV